MSQSEIRPKHRFWIPAVVLFLLMIFVGAVWAIPGEFPAEGDRRSYTILAAVVAALLVTLWFFLLSGFRWWIRGAVFLALALLGASFALPGAPKLIRHVELTGDMEFVIDFPWNKDRRAARDQFLQNAPVAGSDAVDLSTSTPTDVTDYRGARRDGVIAGPKLARDWSQPPRELWKHPVGGGYASFAVVGRWAVTLEQRGPDEAVVCYDIRSGEQCWIHQYPALFSEMLGGDGPRSTPTIVNGRVYSLGARGDLICLEGDTGALVWSVNVLDEASSANLEWGMAGSPLIWNGKVIVSPGAQKPRGPTGSVLAVDANNGKLVWKSGDQQAGYSSPMMATLGGVEQLLVFDGHGISGYLPESGESLWRYPWKSPYDVNAVQPIVVDENRVFITSAAGAALLRVTKTEPGSCNVEAVWTNRNMKADYSSPVLRNGHVYGIDGNILACVELSSGERKWKGGRYGHGQILLRDDLIVVLSEQGVLALVEATPEAFRELGKIQAIEGKTWNNPVLVGDVILVRNHLEMAAFQLPTLPTSPGAD